MVKTQKCQYLNVDGSCSKPSRENCQKKRLPFVVTIFCYSVKVK